MHAAAKTGSTGHGACRLCHCIKAEAPSSPPDIRKRAPLLAESHIMPGNVAVRPAITAPAPTVIRSAGKAQHSNVDVLANSESVGPISVRRSIGFIRSSPLRHVG